MRYLYIIGFILLITKLLPAQTNILSTNSLAEQILLGNYDPANFAASQPIEHPDSVSMYILQHVSPDSLKSYIIRLGSFHNRNSGSDTNSLVTGIGAARKWVYQKFEQFSQAAENRLVPSYLQFDRQICNIDQHKNIFAVLPGKDTSDPSVIVIEAHIDSRCEGLCDPLCSAQGIEDNASGTALVMELARVMSYLTLDHSVVFLLTIAEEQGLYGAAAFADYTTAKNIRVKAVQNNDVIGGILCGETSSPPSCPSLNAVDSTQVRLFSFGNVNSKHKQWARFIKLEYQEQILPYTDVPMQVTIMSAEDRTGRSGDHIPFRQKGYPSMRFTSANEHGDANVSNPNYDDRQHTIRDTLGVDTDGDMIIDSFFVDFRYLSRNAVINGNAAAMAALGPETPDFTATDLNNDVAITITDFTGYPAYRVALRSSTHDWDTVFTMYATYGVFPITAGINYYISVAAVDSLGIESLFSGEKTLQVTSLPDEKKPLPLELLQNRPNPFDEATYIGVKIHQPITYKTAYIDIRDLQGKLFQRLPISLEQGENDVLFIHGYGAAGIYQYTLVIDGNIIATKQMVFAN